MYLYGGLIENTGIKGTFFVFFYYMKRPFLYLSHMVVPQATRPVNEILKNRIGTRDVQAWFLEAINVNLGAKQLSTNVITLWHAKERKDASKSNGTSFAFVYITNEKKNTYRNVYYYLNAQFLLDTFKLSLKNGYCNFFY